MRKFLESLIKCCKPSQRPLVGEASAVSLPVHLLSGCRFELEIESDSLSLQDRGAKMLLLYLAITIEYSAISLPPSDEYLFWTWAENNVTGKDPSSNLKSRQLARTLWWRRLQVRRSSSKNPNSATPISRTVPNLWTRTVPNLFNSLANFNSKVILEMEIFIQ